jgi:hypothetical protein
VRGWFHMEIAGVNRKFGTCSPAAARMDPGLGPDGAEGEDGSVVGLPAAHLFRRHVARGADDLPGNPYTPTIARGGL